MKRYWETIADKLSKAVGAWAGSQPWIPKGERSGLLMHTAITARGVVRSNEMLTAFLELERITHELVLSALLGDDSN